MLREQLGTRSDHVCAGRLLLVVGDLDAAEPTTATLQRDGFCVGIAHSGEDAAHRLAHFCPDVLVVDAGIPDGPALLVFRRLRAVTDAPMVLTGIVGDETKRVRALDAGFDDVLAMSASPAELGARVRAVLRRRPAAPAGRTAVSAGPIAIDEVSHRVWVSGRDVVLTALELRLLVYLCRHAGVALSRAQLLADVWGYTFSDGTTVTVHVRRLREKIEPDPAKPRYINTVRGVGYRFEVM